MWISAAHALSGHGSLRRALTGAPVLLAALLGGCDTVAVAPSSSARADAADTVAGGPFDYRYAYRLPGDRVKTVLENNSRRCEQLTARRCRVTAVRYRVEDGRKVSATLTLRIDPAMARDFGDYVSDSVTRAEGQVIDSEAASGDLARASADAPIAALHRELARIAAGRTTPEGTERTRRIRAALDVISDVTGEDADSLATAPVLITYEATGGLSRIGAAPQATLRNAGETLQRSVAAMVQAMAFIGPWLVLALILVFLLRLLIHGRGGARPILDPVPDGGAHAVPVEGGEQHGARNAGRGLLQRWFGRGDGDRD